MGTDITQLIGRRCLFRIGIGWNSVEEFTILEISPSKSWIKLMDTDGIFCWKALSDVSFVETLEELSENK